MHHVPGLPFDSIILFMCTWMFQFFLFQGGKAVKDEETLESLEVNDGGKLYFKDLGMYKYKTS